MALGILSGNIFHPILIFKAARWHYGTRELITILTIAIAAQLQYQIKLLSFTRKPTKIMCLFASL